MKKKDAETASEVKRDAIARIDDMRQKRVKELRRARVKAC